jgi:hypothetical protein
MAQQRQYEPVMLFNLRIVDMRHLWTPSTEYKGKKQDKPNYFSMFISPRTKAQWHEEPALAGLAAACMKLYANNPQLQIWPAQDGDMPNAEGKSSEFAKGHWILSASTNNPPIVELTQPGGALVKLQNKVGVKSGDFVMGAFTCAVNTQNPRAVKTYLNTVVFTSPGEEIVFANSVSAAQLMEDARKQGFNPTGFSPSPGYGAPAGGGFPGAGQPFVAPGGTPGFTPPAGGFAPPNTAPANPAFGGAPAPSGPAFGGNATFPSSSPWPPR